MTPRHTLAVAAMTVIAAMTVAGAAGAGSAVRASPTMRPEVVGRVGVVAAGRHFAAEAGMRMLARGGNAIDAGVAATFAAAVTEISHFGLGGEVPIIIYRADRKARVVVNGQGPAPAAASPDRFGEPEGIPTNGASAGTVPAVVDALALALSEHGTLTLGDVLAPAIALADGFVWYEFLAGYLRGELDAIRKIPSGARVYLPGPDASPPAVGSVFRQPELAATLRSLAEEERRHAHLGRVAAIEAARDSFYRGGIGRRIADAVQQAGGLLTAEDLARYRGRLEAPTSREFVTRRGRFEILKTGFWGQGPVLLQALALLDGVDLAGMGHNSTAYIHVVTEALKLALADRDSFYADPDVVPVPARGLLSDDYATERRKLIDPLRADNSPRPGDPWRFEPGGPRRAASAPLIPVRRTSPAPGRLASFRESPDTTTVNVVDAAGNLFSASPSSAWFFGGVFIAGDTGVPLGNRMQAFVTWQGHPNIVQGGKRPRTTLTPTVILRDGKPFAALSSPGGDSQDQQALQVFLNMAVFGMTPQAAIEAPRFNTLSHHESFGAHRFRSGVLQVEDRISPDVVEALRQLGHRITVLGSFMMDTGTALVGVDSTHDTLFGAADIRRQRFVTGW